VVGRHAAPERDGRVRTARAAQRRRGLHCLAIALLEGREVDDELVTPLGGPAADYVLSGGERAGPGTGHGCGRRADCCTFSDDAAMAAIVGATADEAWRVRGMAAKVIARHDLGDALGAVAALRDDSVARVWAAARHAVETLTLRRA